MLTWGLGFYDMHLGISVCTAKHTVQAQNMLSLSSEADKHDMTWGTESLTIQELYKGSL